jgi:hypothetical protein
MTAFLWWEKDGRGLEGMVTNNLVMIPSEKIMIQALERRMLMPPNQKKIL